MINQLFSLRALSPLHCGIGQGLNDIDLPTAKSPVSGHPIIPGSSLKGVLKNEFIHNDLRKDEKDENWGKKIRALFGEDGVGTFASAIAFGDAMLLALPVRSCYGTFAYLTTPFTLYQLSSFLERVPGHPHVPCVPTKGLTDHDGTHKVFLTKDSVLQYTDYENTKRKKVLLEELDLLIEESREVADAWADFIAPLFFSDKTGQAIFKKRLAIVDDTVLNFFCDTALPVDARIRIDEETGAVKPGALWYEETIPPETLFTGVVGVDRSYSSEIRMGEKDLLAILTEGNTIHCQIGGKATTGKGVVALDFPKGENEDKGNNHEK